MTTGRNKLQRSGFKDSQHGSDVAVTSCQVSKYKRWGGGEGEESLVISDEIFSVAGSNGLNGLLTSVSSPTRMVESRLLAVDTCTVAESTLIDRLGMFHWGSPS